MVKAIGNPKQPKKSLFDKYANNKISQQLSAKKQAEADREKEVADSKVDPRRAELIRDLHFEYFWREVKKGLAQTEIGFFEDEWASYGIQFSDILHTDKISIKDAILLEIEANRINQEKKDIIDEIAEVDQEIKAEEKKKSAKDKELIASLRERRASLRSIFAPLNKRYMETQSEKDKRFRALRANREQRLKRTIESTTNIFDLIKQLSTLKERIKVNKEISFHNDAVEVERRRLMEPHKYLDGTTDCQLLSADTLDYLEKKEADENGGTGSDFSTEENPVVEESVVGGE
jgi:hypothetical protein